jgi:hypothetical protein
MKKFLPVLLLAAGILSSSLLQAQKIIKGEKGMHAAFIDFEFAPKAF